MATSKTGSFYLTETITLPALSADNTRVQGTIDLGAYINVPTGQALAVESVDFVHQVTSDYGGNVDGMVSGNAAISSQLTDQNPGTVFVRADDQSLIASSSLNISDLTNQATHTSDLYPDNFGPANLSEAFLVVNDMLYFVAGNDGNAIQAETYITARIRCRVVKLNTKDWMAIAIQSTAADN